MIKTFDTLENVVQEIKPLFSRIKPSAVPYMKEVNGIPIKVPEEAKVKLWKIHEKACMDTLKYVFAISHQCYLLVIAEGAPIMYKLMPPLQPLYTKALDQAFKKLKDNTHLTDGIRTRIQKMHPTRIMQCVVKERVREPVELESNEYLTVFSKLNLPDGFFILNLTDALIVRKDQTYPFHMVFKQSLIHPPAMIPILSMSGQKGYIDIPIPNYDELDWVYAKEGQDIYEGFVTDWDKKGIVKAVFRGGPTGCGYTTETNMRIKLLKMSQTSEFKELLDIGISGKGKTIDTASVKFDPVHGLGMLNTGLAPTDKFLKMAEQSQYQFILHVDGNVNAYRMLYTMSTGSVLLRVMSEYTSWAEQYLVENEHYIAIDADLSNLKMKMEWCMKNPRKCKEISERAQHLARTLLSRDFLDNYFSMIFSTFSGETVEQSFQDYKKTRKKLRFERLPQADPNPRPARVALIIPHRNRVDHLKQLMTRLDAFNLGSNTIDVYVIDQNNSEKFNRGLLLNIGFYLAEKQHYDRYIFHDVDSYPDEELFPQYFQFLDDSIHFASPSLGYKYTYPEFLGGVEGFTEEDYKTINGFPNTFFGWGGEDDALYNRLAAENITLYRPTKGKYILADHEQAKGAEKNQMKYENILEDLSHYKENGVQQLPQYSIQITPFSLEDFVKDYRLDKPNPVPTKSELVTFSMEPKKESRNVYTFKVQYDLINSKLLPKVDMKLEKDAETDKNTVNPVNPVNPVNEENVVIETVQDSALYVPSILNIGLYVPFHQAGKNMDSYFLAYASEHLEGRCWKEGFVRPGATKVFSYTAGLLNGTTIEYQVLYLVEVCFPYESMEVECIVKNVNKIGIRATVREKQNPMVLYVTREHNQNVLMEEYKPGQKIKVKLLGHRFEQGDPSIVVLGELVGKEFVAKEIEKNKSNNKIENE
jgi:hypothetical protein